MLTNTTLSARSSEFDALLQKSVFTDKKGKALEIESATRYAMNSLREVAERSGNVYVIGNGGSAAIASHVVTDLCNVAGIRAMTLHEPSVFTCFCNDFGYAQGFSKRLSKVAIQDDLLIAVSSSGQSENILNAAKVMQALGGDIITLSAFSFNNPLRKMGMLNYWVGTDEYGLAELAHLFVLHHWSDRIGIEWPKAVSQNQCG